MSDTPTLTPDGVAYAQFILKATPEGGLAVSNAIMLLADITVTDMLCRDNGYTDSHFDEDAARLKGLFPFIRALSPMVADGYAMKFPFLWECKEGD